MALDVHIPQTHILSKYHNNFGMIWYILTVMGKVKVKHTC
jgi:hypothetical protein